MSNAPSNLDEVMIKASRPGVKIIRIKPKGTNSKYEPHQGNQEKKRRLARI